MRRYLLILTSFLCLFSSFFWEDDEREIKALHQLAESAMRDADFPSAIEAYTSLLKRVDLRSGKKNSVTWQTYIDFAMRLAIAYGEIEEVQEGIRVLSELLEKEPPEAFIPRIRLERARLTSLGSQPQEAFFEMQGVIDSNCQHDWSKEELSFYHALRYALDAQYEDGLRKAKRLIAAGFHLEAIQIYEEVLEAIQSGHFPKARQNELIEKKLRYLLVEANYQLKNYEKSALYAQASIEASTPIDCEILYLLALSYKEQKEYEKAIEHFTTYVENGKEHYEQALFEIGYHHYQMGEKQRAHHFFDRLQQTTSKKPKPRIVAAIYLAKMAIEAGKFEEVDPLLAPLANLLPPRDPLRLELSFLRGRASFLLEDFATASEFFDASLSSKGGGSWRLSALYYLGWSYLKLGDDPKKSEQARSFFLAKAEGVFLHLLTTKEEEAATLALGRLYLVQGGEHLETRLDALLQDRHFSIEGEHESLLLQAEAASQYEKRTTLYQEACSSRFASCATFPKAWYLLGVNHFQEGLNQPEQGELLFAKAIEGFEEAFLHYRSEDPKIAARILKLEAKADFYRNSPSTSMAYLEELLEQYGEAGEEREETLYLRGMIAASLHNRELAEHSLQQVCSHYPKGRYADDALFVLATLYFQEERFGEAEEAFLSLAKHYPQSEFAGDGWFWAAEASEKQGNSAKHIRKLRQQVYLHYPQSTHAPMAYFKQYDELDYLDGEEKALSHLMPFPQLFPHSSLVVTVHTLMGLHAHTEEKKRWRYNEAIRTFLRCSHPDSRAVSFYYQARLELAELYSHHGHIEEALKLLDLISFELSNEEHRLAARLEERTKLYERTEYVFGSTYFAAGNLTKARQRLTYLIDHCRKRGLKTGYYLALAWQRSAMVAMEGEDLDTAMHCFELAEECRGDFFSNEERLELWLAKSRCLREKGDFDVAMRLLSKIINADIASSLRLEAMYERACLYELQERPELAYRQLESMIKMGGEWGESAARKLKEDYGFWLSDTLLHRVE